MSKNQPSLNFGLHFQEETPPFPIPSPTTSLSPELTVIPANPREEKIRSLSPVMTQYLEIKQDYPHALLFFRMGDFYELFFEDAVTAAKELDIVLTKRGKTEGDDIAMCGVPAHAYESYLSRLINKGYKVAICEQLEDPETAKKRGSKGPLRRDVIRVVTPGTLTEETLLESRTHNFLVAFSPPKGKDTTPQKIGVALIDVSTGTFLIETTDLMGIPGILARLMPAEIIFPDRLLMEPALYDHLAPWKKKITSLPQARFDYENGKERLEATYQVKTLDAFGTFSSPEIQAAGALLSYIHTTQKSALRLLDRPRQLKNDMMMVIDAPTRRSLELHCSQSGQRQGGLLDTIDYTVTAAGGRLLSLQLSTPLMTLSVIEERLNAVEFFVNNPNARTYLRDTLQDCPDMERALSRLNFQRGSPRDLLALKNGLSIAMEIRTFFHGSSGPDSPDLPTGLSKTLHRLGHHHDLIDKLTRALMDPAPPHTRDGDFIADGYHTELDAFRYLCQNSQEAMDRLQASYISRTGINTLKIKHNNVIGYHIDVGPSHAAKIPADFIHRQTLASSLRYTTPELSDIEHKITVAAQQSLELELQLFGDLVSDVQLQLEDLLTCCRSLAALDVSSALAECAQDQGFTRPQLDTSTIFHVEGAFHPVVASLLKEKGETQFVANSCTLDPDNHIYLLTGPNMAGKSTYLRQNALLAVLAQMGSYVPAQKAHMGLVDRIFSRVGAADDLASGRSTFMVEMVETATILHQATEKSFVILDEIGRGTATYDGLSIAWSVIEYLAQHNKCRTLFATHYHELTVLETTIPTLKCHTMRIKEWEDKVIFMHEVIPGQADKSYGIYVAALAGLPSQVIQRSTQILSTLETSAEGKGLSTPPPPPPPVQERSRVEKKLLTLDPDQLTPRQALDVLCELKLLC